MEASATASPMALQVPERWRRLDVAPLQGTLLVIGAPDSGKSTFARYLFRRLAEVHGRVAFLDGDVGQATLGPPTTMTLVVGEGETTFPPAGLRRRVFVGNISPRGHMLPLVVGASRLQREAIAQGAKAVVVDTTGLVAPDRGGVALKEALIALLEPTVVFALARQRELEPILFPLRRSRRVRVIEMPVAPAVRRRPLPVRQAHRITRFRDYFAQARDLAVRWDRLALFGGMGFLPRRLLAFEDARGFALALGVLMDHDRATRTLTVRTPLPGLDGVDALRLGNLFVDPETGKHWRGGGRRA